jgi:TatD DNase family protein
VHELIDIGANLTHDSFDRDLAEILDRAAAAGVTRLIVTGTSLEASHKAVRLAETRPGSLFATAGLHPHHASDFDADYRAGLQQLANGPHVVAVGECGLDYFRAFSPRDAQAEAFVAQLGIAAEIGKPVFLHQRDAHQDFVAILADHLPQISGGVAHCFTGGPAELGEILELGLYVGITGWICDDRRGAALRDAVRQLPLERLLLETDAPYLLPRDLPQKPSGRRNEPAFLPHILAVVAHYMQQPADVLAEASAHNAEQLFALPSDT